jgi:hypothetical protein
MFIVQAAAKILSVKAGTSIDLPIRIVGLPALFCHSNLCLLLRALVEVNFFCKVMYLEQSPFLRYLW